MIKHLLNLTSSNIRSVLPGQNKSDVGLNYIQEVLERLVIRVLYNSSDDYAKDGGPEVV